MSLASRVAVFAVCGLVGGFIVLLYLGVIPWKPARRCSAVFCDPYHWQVLCFGLVFTLAGLMFIIPGHWRRTGRLVTWGFLLCLVAGLVGSLAAR